MKVADIPDTLSSRVLGSQMLLYVQHAEDKNQARMYHPEYRSFVFISFVFRYCNTSHRASLFLKRYPVRYLKDII